MKKPSKKFEPESIPNEIWTSIFEQVLGLLPRTSPLHSSTRRNLCNVCIYMRAIIRGNEKFWEGLFFSSSTPFSVLEDWSTYSGSKALEAVIFLAADMQHVSTPIWNVIGSTLSRCRDLSFHVSDAESWSLLDAKLVDADLLRLERITLRIGDGVLEQVSAQPVFARFGESLLRNTTHLCLHGISLEWSFRHTFRALTSLAIVNPVWSPSWSDYRALAANAPGIRRLCLRNVGCSNSPASLADVIHFSTLVEFDFSFGSRSPSSSLIVRHCSMPSLRVLRFDGAEPGHVMALAFCATMLSTVETLHISGAVEDDGFSYFLFIRLPRLRSLEIPASDSYFLDAILDADTSLSRQSPPEGPSCPVLAHIFVSEAAPARLGQFIGRRYLSGARRLERIDFARAQQSLADHCDLSLLRAEVEEIRFIDMPREPRWISGKNDWM